MKREFLKELRLEEETINKIMAENGKDIEKYKTLSETKEKEVKTLQGQLDTANKEIESYKEMDIESIKQSARDFQKKLEDTQVQAKADIEKLQFDHALEKALAGAKARNVKAVKALLDLEGLKLNNGELVGINEQLEKIKQENNYLFEIEELVDKTPGITTKINKNNSEWWC
ncbi:phage scaffolding protein [Irregularibacter muris]|uniref:Phage scaffolding protein n=1 Tax=Irregularibacter muris TaxID=1796619 RepID=A0AAE3KZ75_9FIRM|nr:phage scaffolding protein [Irregularibacter muris]MCR1897812.1 phage scaffolding protein [Irregularibacter muris]